jgi:predicted nucleic acid-binding protein
MLRLRLLEMQKLILDTNIIVSALISNSIPTKILYELFLNTLDFQITEFEYTRIMTPREYWDFFKPR